MGTDEATLPAWTQEKGEVPEEEGDLHEEIDDEVSPEAGGGGEVPHAVEEDRDDPPEDHEEGPRHGGAAQSGQSDADADARGEQRVGERAEDATQDQDARQLARAPGGQALPR